MDSLHDRVGTTLHRPSERRASCSPTCSSQRCRFTHFGTDRLCPAQAFAAALVRERYAAITTIALVVGYAGMLTAPNAARSGAGGMVIGSSSLISSSPLSKLFRRHIAPMNVPSGSDTRNYRPMTQSTADMDFLLVKDRHWLDAVA